MTEYTVSVDHRYSLTGELSTDPITEHPGHHISRLLPAFACLGLDKRTTISYNILRLQRVLLVSVSSTPFGRKAEDSSRHRIYMLACASLASRIQTLLYCHMQPGTDCTPTLYFRAPAITGAETYTRHCRPGGRQSANLREIPLQAPSGPLNSSGSRGVVYTMVTTRKGSSANSDDEPLYERRCIVSTCNNPILPGDSSDKVCNSCKQVAKNASAKLKARRLRSTKVETGLLTPKSEVKSGKGSDKMKRQGLSPLPSIMEPKDTGNKRKLGDVHSSADEVTSWRSPKSQMVGECTEGNGKTDQRSKSERTGRLELIISSDDEENAPKLPNGTESVEALASKDADTTSIVPMTSMITKSRSIINPDALKSIGINVTEPVAPSPPDSTFKSTLPGIQTPHSNPSSSDRSPLKPRNEDPKRDDSPPLPGGSSAPLEDPLFLPVDSPSLPEDPLFLPEDYLPVTCDSPPIPEGRQDAADNMSTDGWDENCENMDDGGGDQLPNPTPILEPTSSGDTPLKQPASTTVLPSNGRDFTGNGIVQFQPSVPFVMVSLDSIEPILNPNSVLARLSKNPLDTEPNSLDFDDILSNYRGSDDEFMAQTLFDLRTEDQSYISIQAKINARGGRKRQFGKVRSTLNVDSTWGKHQNQPWKINPAALNRDDLPLQLVLRGFNAKDVVPTVAEGELYLTQHEEYEGPRRTWRYGDGGAGKEEGYPEAQAGAWAHLAKAAR
ncbi:hypothetical protein V490_03781 [Pseudogymnoascus sp. VKM F-3557]|nr:hypothetical protein V490_03781 [Pseudogymnoascus sp. VKM F-3557]